MGRGWQISSTARINFQFALPQSPSSADQHRPQPPPRPQHVHPQWPYFQGEDWPNVNLEARADLRSTVQPARAALHPPPAQLGSRPCLWNQHCSNDKENENWKKLKVSASNRLSGPSLGSACWYWNAYWWLFRGEIAASQKYTQFIA